MARFEIEKDGRRFEVEAPDQDTALRALGAMPPASAGETATDVARQTAIGYNRGIDSLLNLPGDILMRAPARALGLEQYVPQRGSYATRFNPGGSLNVTSPPDSAEPRTTPGRYAESVGQALGASTIPAAGLMAAAPRLATVAATTVPRAIARTVGTQVARAPAAAVGTDIVASTGAGLAQQGAEDAGAGPLGQTLAGIAGGIAPFAPLAAVGGARRAVNTYRARSDPYARIAASLGDTSIDDVANAASVGATRNDAAVNRPVFDILGEEMVRANGNRQAAVAATRARLVANGVNPNTADDQISRVMNAQRGNDLMLGEYPAVTTADMATRQRNPYAPRSQAGRNATTIFEEEFTRGGGDRVAATRATLDRLVAGGVPRRDATRMLRDILRGRVTDREIGAGADRVPGTQQQMDYVANAGSQASSQGVRAAVTERAANLGERMMDMVRRLSPGGRSIRDVEDMANQLQQRLSAEY